MSVSTYVFWCTFEAYLQILWVEYWIKEYMYWGFPDGAVVKNPPANAGDTGLSPVPGRSHMPQSN